LGLAIWFIDAGLLWFVSKSVHRSELTIKL
jgi:hypothetical protein